jgi:outer membrane lipoprotein-sorting protein
MGTSTIAGSNSRCSIILSLALCVLTGVSAAQQADEAATIRAVDAAVMARFDAISSYTVTEHYAVFRNKDEIHPAAEMTVRTDYNKATGKTYIVLSRTGSDLLQKFVLDTILENEKRINLPGNREKAWLTSANYEMKLNAGEPQRFDGRDCLVLTIHPRSPAPNLLDGTLWVDSKDGSIVQIQGKASQSVSHFTGPTEMERQYANVDGFAMATHAHATTSSFLFGPTIITIDYRDYQIQLNPAH